MECQAAADYGTQPGNDPNDRDGRKPPILALDLAICAGDFPVLYAAGICRGRRGRGFPVDRRSCENAAGGHIHGEGIAEVVVPGC